MGVGKHLHLHVARVGDELFHIDIRRAKRSHRLTLRQLQHAREVLCVFGKADALASAAGHCFHQHRIANTLCLF
ncbi:hypothetical protein HRbin16_03326 [bacterium HR16]|nr:hypothetical protein HRbin16_03326 [bacterium HR16]